MGGGVAGYYRGVVNTVRSVPRFDPEWLEDPRLRAGLAVQDVQVLFRWLHARGWSQAQIGAATGQSQPEVSAILKGRQVKAYAVLLRIAQGLGIPLGYLRLGSCVACDGGGGSNVGGSHLEGDEAVFRRQFLAAAGAIAAGGAIDGVSGLFPSRASPVRAVPARVGAAEVAQVRTTIAQLRNLEYQLGYGASLDAARGFAGWAHGLLNSRQSQATARDLRLALADLHTLIAWSFAEGGGLPTSARRHHLQALALAREADEPALVGAILGDMAHLSVINSDPREGSRLAGFGLLATDHDGVLPAVRAALYLEDARARAHLADERGVLDALSRVADDLARTDPAAVPPWASTSSMLLKHPGAHAGIRGQVYQVLARTPAFRHYAEIAVADTATALAAYDGQRSWTGHVLDRLSLAAGLLYTGALDDGVVAANEALDKAAALQSAKVLARLTDISNAARHYTGHPDAEDLRSHIAALTAA